MIYEDKNGKEIKIGMIIRHDDGETEKVYETSAGGLGINASNENYIGFCEHFRELYPLDIFNLNEWEVVENSNEMERT